MPALDLSKFQQRSVVETCASRSGRAAVLSYKGHLTAFASNLLCPTFFSGMTSRRLGILTKIVAHTEGLNTKIYLFQGWYNHSHKHIWSHLATDFIKVLTKSQSKTTILGVMYRFSRLPISFHLDPHIQQELAQTFMDNVVKLHGSLMSKVRDRNPHFLEWFVENYSSCMSSNCGTLLPLSNKLMERWKCHIECWNVAWGVWLEVFPSHRQNCFLWLNCDTTNTSYHLAIGMTTLTNFLLGWWIKQRGSDQKFYSQQVTIQTHEHHIAKAQTYCKGSKQNGAVG